MKKKITGQRPAPRFTQNQLEAKLFSSKPDPGYIIQEIQEEISCLQSEKRRLDAKNTKALAQRNVLLEKNQETEQILNDLIQKIELTNDEICQHQSQINTFIKDVEVAQRNAEEIQKMLLSNQQYETRLKELRQLTIKKSMTAKKLKSAKKLIQKIDFTNLKDALQMYQEDISTLEINNFRIEKQINLVTQQVERIYRSMDQAKLNELKSMKDKEIQILLHKIRDAKRKDTFCQDEDDDDDDDNYIIDEYNPNSSLYITKPGQKPVSVSDPKMSKRSSSSSLGINKIRKASLLYDFKEEFKDMKYQIDGVKSSLEKIIKQNEEPKNSDMVKLLSEVETVAATLEAETRNAQFEIKLEEQCQLEMNCIDATLSSRRDELESIKSENVNLQSEIDQLIQKKTEIKRSLDELIVSETPEVQKYVKEIYKHCIKCEEDIDKMRNEEAELKSRREQLTNMKSSKEITMFNELMNRRNAIEEEIGQLKGSLRQSTGMSKGNYEKIQRAKLQKSQLLIELKKYENALNIDQEELNELEKYANMLIILVNSSGKKKSYL